MKNRTKAIEKASLAGVVGNGILAVLKISLGLISGSLALVGAGIDTTTDIITSLITLFAARIAAAPPDPKASLTDTVGRRPLPRRSFHSLSFSRVPNWLW